MQDNLETQADTQSAMLNCRHSEVWWCEMSTLEWAECDWFKEWNKENKTFKKCLSMKCLWNASWDGNWFL